MEKIFGTTFRKQMQQQPLWLRLVLWFFTGLFIFWTGWWMLRAGEWLWLGYRSLPPSRQMLTGRLAALGFGVVSLLGCARRWRITYFLDPCMRDLVTTPGSPWQIFRLGLRARWNWAGAAYTSIFLYPYFGPEWLLALPVSAWGWRVPLSIVCAIGWACLGQLLFHLLAMALVLPAAALGVGGAAPRFTLPSMLRPLLFAIQFAMVPLLAMALTVSIVDKPGQILAASAWWRVGGMIVDAVNEQESFAQTCLLNFPSVLWFDALRAAIPGPPEAFATAMLGYAAWIGAGSAAVAMSIPAGLGMAARATWHLDPNAAKPADALPEKKQRHDPDHINGPLESWMIARVGRMGRAVLRLASAVFDVGAIDRHMAYSVALVPVCLAGGYATMWILPDLIDFVGLSLIRTKLGARERESVRTIAAAGWVVVILFYRMSIWGAMRMHVEPTQKNGLPPNWAGTPALGGNVSFLMVRDPSLPASRGDNRYPLAEIYPVGFSDAVLLPTLYTLLWVTFLGALALAECALLGLDLSVSTWCVAIGVPALTELCFLAALGNSVSNWMDYRRSRLVSFVKSVSIGLAVAMALIGMAFLIILLCKETIGHGRAWVAWLGSLNMILIFDVALYMTGRWVYVRRRFDAERRQVKGFGQ